MSLVSSLLEQEEGGIQLPVEQVKMLMSMLMMVMMRMVMMMLVMIMARMMITMILVKH